MLLHYSVFDVSDTLLVMRPYQIAATERILVENQQRLSSQELEQYGKGGGLSGTPPVPAKRRPASRRRVWRRNWISFDKVFFVVDRKDWITRQCGNTSVFAG